MTPRGVRRGGAAALLAAIAAAGCAAEAPDAPTSTPPVTSSVEVPARFESAPCPVEATAPARCGTVAVPVRHGRPDDARYVLPVVVLGASEGPSGSASALVVPSGGPGSSNLDDIGWWAANTLRRTHDIVLYDQRGIGAARPALDCPEVEDAVLVVLGAAAPPADERALVVAAAASCRARLLAEGVDLGSFTTDESAGDLEMLRRALGYDRIDLLGTSYGSRLALAYARRFPGAVRAMVLDSVYPPTVGGDGADLRRATRAWDALIDGCAADAGCRSAYPDLRASFTAAVERLDRAPFRADVDVGGRFGSVTITVTGADLAAGLFQAMYDTDVIGLLPSLIDAVARGDTTALPLVASRAVPFVTSGFEAMGASTDCADNRRLPPTPVPDDALLSTIRTLQGAADCTVWTDGIAPDGFNEAVDVRVPALVLAGSYDPATPPAYSEAAARALPGSSYALFERAGHGVAFVADCPRRLVAAFLADPAAPVDTACAATWGAPVFR